MITLPRRRFLQGLIGLVAAPAIVRVSSIMSVKAAPLYDPRCDTSDMLRQANDIFDDMPPPQYSPLPPALSAVEAGIPCLRH